jgi:hypothetical protein
LFSSVLGADEARLQPATRRAIVRRVSGEPWIRALMKVADDGIVVVKSLGDDALREIVATGDVDVGDTEDADEDGSTIRTNVTGEDSTTIKSYIVAPGSLAMPDEIVIGYDFSAGMPDDVEESSVAAALNLVIEAGGSSAAVVVSQADAGRASRLISRLANQLTGTVYVVETQSE